MGPAPHSPTSSQQPQSDGDGGGGIREITNDGCEVTERTGVVKPVRRNRPVRMLTPTRQTCYCFWCFGRCAPKAHLQCHVGAQCGRHPCTSQIHKHTNTYKHTNTNAHTTNHQTTHTHKHTRAHTQSQTHSRRWLNKRYLHTLLPDLGTCLIANTLVARFYRVFFKMHSQSAGIVVAPGVAIHSIT